MMELWDYAVFGIEAGWDGDTSKQGRRIDGRRLFLGPETLPMKHTASNQVSYECHLPEGNLDVVYSSATK